MEFLPENQPESGRQPACVEVMPIEGERFGNLDDPNSDISVWCEKLPIATEAGAGHKTEGLPRSFNYGR